MERRAADLECSAGGMSASVYSNAGIARTEGTRWIGEPSREYDSRIGMIVGVAKKLTMPRRIEREAMAARFRGRGRS